MAGSSIAELRARLRALDEERAALRAELQGAERALGILAGGAGAEALRLGQALAGPPTGRAAYDAEVRRMARRMGISPGLLKSDPLFRYHYAILKRERALEKRGQADRSATGALAKTLEWFGYRNPAWRWPVGDTPKVRR